MIKPQPLIAWAVTCCLYTLLPSTAYAEIYNSDGSIYTGRPLNTLSQPSRGTEAYYQQQILDNQQQILSHLGNNPLGGREQGIEFNIIRLLNSDSDNITLSGTYSRFKHDENVELAFPLFYAKETYNNEPSTHVTNADIHYRKYLGPKIGGFYMSGFGRYSHINGALKDDTSKTDTTNKLGLGVGIGYRKFSESGLYWGTSLNLGHYLIGDSQRFADAPAADDPMIIDVEMLKFGYAY